MEVHPEEMHEMIKSLRSEESDVPIMEMEFECTLSPPSAEKYEPKTHVGCDGAIAYCTLVSNGDVLPCHFFSGVEADNVRDKSFAWIWENSQILNYFRSLTISDIRGTCQECAWLPECRGGCIANGYVNGDIFESNRHCWIAKAFMPK
jgi:radical SAM protein with 4Fe4S-binding SPASM domain